ncbi:DUF418 domain-containing protein [Novosphingobium sp. Gsoil 351]|uniref:DUF418 domain-containing protein n=1 Tax=Novosphingobium sp. Gsoil 351 TaxID=2675225 RepID=UPI0012B48390|nr:DUF418 domain-containing protein [Novosphingobium sp. Gsoil 351]QGN54521.1 DUF418 domain-containing protein [Novosphingobium sp. Gsoil 351]
MQSAEQSPSRLIALDFVRGVAILGILLLNIVGFAWPEIVYVSPRAPTAPVSIADDWTWLAVFVLADGKFRGLFSLLFGASMLLFVERAEASGRDGAALQQRRLGWLALFGLAHFFLLWWGDILFLYAVCGFFALALRHLTPQRLAIAALTIYAIGAVTLGALTAGGAAPWLGWDDVGGGTAASIIADYGNDARAEIPATLAPWSDHVAHMLRDNWTDPLTTVAMTWFETIPLMLIGMALFKTGLFAGIWKAARLKRWAWRGIGGGLVLTLPLAWWLWREDFALPLTLFVWLGPAAAGRLASTLGYAAFAVVLARRWAGSALGGRLVACGRMAFSNYIATSLAMTFIFHGWGLGLFARIGRFELLAFVLLGWGLMLAWSRPWLARFRLGPLEWLWRSLTYGRIAPMRKPLAIESDSQ